MKNIMSIDDTHKYHEKYPCARMTRTNREKYHAEFAKVKINKKNDISTKCAIIPESKLQLRDL